jgi:acetylornithine deacetylase/succinyl-diaminopimelate desuccinylase-like protein
MSGKPAIGFTGHLDTVPLGAHQTDEYCLVSRIEQATVYSRMMRSWCGV